MEIREAVIVDTIRTPIGKRKGALAGWHPSDLLAFTLQRLIERTGVDPERVDDVVGGCVTQAGEQGCNVTRNAWVAAGFPQSVPATSVDRQCGSSQQAVHFAAQAVMSGCYDLAIACGTESMTRAPMASNASGGIGPFSPDFLAACDGKLMTQFEVAQILADRFKIGRDDMDEYALESHRRAAAAVDSGAVKTELVPVPIEDVDAIECNEAFAAIALMWAREFVPDPALYNARGGAIAIGHPLGVSGVRIMTTLLNQLEATGGRYGFQTMCEGGGMANATVIERVS